MAREPQSVDDLLVPANVVRRPMPANIGLSAPRYFPPPTATNPDGLLCVGGRLTPEWLLDAYSHGIFPWPMWDNEPVVWWSPDPRAIFELDAFHISRRLARTLRSGPFTVTSDRDFDGVIRSCATVAGRRGNTWLTPTMIDAYCRMHALGHAHSVEVWGPLPPGRRSAVAEESRDEEELADGPHPKFLTKGEGICLVGGTYGIAIGGLFAAESMFYRVRDASKVALAHLVAHLSARGYQLFDIQQWTPHTGSLGAIEIPRNDYLRRLARAIEFPATFGEVRCGDLA